MKRLQAAAAISLIFFIYYKDAKGQQVEWFQPGQEWFFKRACAFPPFECGYSHFTVGESIEIGGAQATSVERITVDETGQQLSAETHFFRASGDSVFHYYAPSDLWYPLYSFNTPVGDTWVIQGETYVGYGSEDDLENWRFEVRVDSISTVMVDGTPRRVIHTSPSGMDGNGLFSLFWFESGIVEGIGATGSSLFGEAPTILPGTPAVFSCFLENDQVVYGPFAYPCLILSTADALTDQIHVFPNPTSGDLTAVLPETIDGTVEVQIVDIAGRMVFDQVFQAESGIKLELPNVSKGIYLLNMTTTKGSLSRRIIVE